MKRLLVLFGCLGVFVLSAFGQSGRARVVATPTPAPPVIQNDSQPTNGQRNAPVLLGAGNQTRVATPGATPPAKEEDEVIKVETNLVTMPVSVLDRDGRFISGLTQKDFKIFENGVEQQVDYFQSVEQPFTVVLLIDVSPSTRYRIEEIHQAAIAFIEQLRPNDRVMVMSFDEEVHVLSPPTNDRFQLRRAIQTSQFGDGTSLYEAVDQALNRELKRVTGRKAIVLFTDGVDTTSRSASLDGTLRDVEETDSLIYPIRYNTERDGWGGGGWGGGTYPNPRRTGGGGSRILDDIIAGIMGGSIRTMPRGGNQGDYETGRRYLENLALYSGGRKFEADTFDNLTAAFSGIAEELRRQYSLGYYPDKVGEAGERRQISIRVNRPNVVVRAKNSYIFGDSSNRVSVK